ncbi:ribokinase [Actinoalloteichus hymeniacidonis]|uniref:Ribokinase n=1 Tax=Actinoalloteichus hymeniacidonis TaxID=340345 RepID=A0AAC9HVZ3_9PSEU|nr:ribokinase [Actinoalloteichus hymeniacidonis]AOS66161.1 sugar kinase, ribokinase [Actinoalloteichus hymeniacidonis]MBB5905736.1 ribokinase [Actinoalloteichus hymeniacidonis]
MTKQADVVVIGSANADLVVTVDRRPAAGETVLGDDVTTIPGGKGANQAVAAGRLGGAVALLGAVGADQYGELLRESLRAAMVDTCLLRTVERPTGNAFITLTPDGENTIVVSPGANAAVLPADVVEAASALAAAKVVALSLEIPLETVRHAVAAASAAGARVLLNLSPVAPLDEQTLRQLDPLVVNEHEAAWLLEERAAADPATTARRLLELGVRSVVVTLGASGAVVADSTGTTAIDAPRVRAVDSTGAGDAFAGALAVGLADGRSLVEAATFAARVAATAVTRPGAQPSYPTLSEVIS